MRETSPPGPLSLWERGRHVAVVYASKRTSNNLAFFSLLIAAVTGLPLSPWERGPGGEVRGEVR